MKTLLYAALGAATVYVGGVLAVVRFVRSLPPDIFDIEGAYDGTDVA